MVVYSISKICQYSNGAMENVKKIHQEMVENTYKCKCGHSVVIKPQQEKSCVIGVTNMYLRMKRMSLNFV